MALVGVAALAIGFLAGAQAAAPSSGCGGSTADELGETVAALARAVERVESRLAMASPTLAATPGEPEVEPSVAHLAAMLAAITERLDRLSTESGAGRPPEVARERTTEQDARVQALAEDEPQGVQRKHFMLTGRDLLERFGLPDRASYWTGATVRWVYHMNSQVPSAGPDAIFELIDDYVTAAFVERRSR